MANADLWIRGQSRVGPTQGEEIFQPPFSHGDSIEGDFPSLEGGEQTARYMRFTDLNEIAAKEDELRRIVVAWCEQKDAG